MRQALAWKRGATREVFLMGKLAIKIPSFRSYKLFLRGLLCNLQERFWWKETHDKRLCPVLFSDWFGLLVVMPRVTILWDFTDKQAEVVWEYFEGLPRESKPNNFGFHNGDYLLVDYGS
jgi:hypothetical protein